MNKERILALADLIEQQPHAPGGHNESESGFNMNYLQHSCGTPGCIAGWALHMFGDNVGSFDEAEELLGCDIGELGRLFFPVVDILYKYIKPDHAARTLRHFAETGVVDWKVGAP